MMPLQETDRDGMNAARNACLLSEVEASMPQSKTPDLQTGGPKLPLGLPAHD